MAIWGEGNIVVDGVSTWQATLQSLATAVGGLVGGWYLTRRKFSADTTAIAHDKQERDFIKLLVARYTEALQMSKEDRDKRLDDAGTIARQTALLESYRERLEGCEASSIKSESKAAESEERARALSDELLAAHMRADQILAVLVGIDPVAAQRFLRSPPGQSTVPRTIRP